MMQHSKGRQVSLRGASVKEVTRDVLLEKVAQERASRGHAKKVLASALFIQRVWRGNSTARKVADQTRAEWDAMVCQSEGCLALTAREVSDKVVRPILFFIGHSSRISLTADAEDLQRLATCFGILLKSISESDPRNNYCSLAVGWLGGRIQWLHQVHKLLSLCCAVLSKSTYGSLDLDGAAPSLPALSVRLLVALTDNSMWKNLQQAKPDEKAEADEVVLRVLEWLAKGNGGLYQAVQAYLLTNYPVPEKSSELNPSPSKDQFIITASAITVALRPLLVLSAAGSKSQSCSAGQLKDYRGAAARAAAQFCLHVLTIPSLTQRLPPPLVPALQHSTALGPCLRSFGVPMKGLFKIAFSASSFSSAALVPVKGEPQYEEVPCSAWALANIVNLASASGQGTNRSREFGGQFVKGLICEEYVQALCCLLDDLTPWIENENRKHVDNETTQLENPDEDKRAHPHPVGELLVDLLRPLHQQWLLLELLTVASNTVDQGVNLQKGLGLSEVAKLYSNLLTLFSALNSFGGALPVLNILAFTQSLLPRFWGWIYDVLKLQEVSGSKMNAQSGKVPAEGSKKPTLEKENKSTGTKWAAALATKMKVKSSAAESSTSILESGPETSHQNSLQQWDMGAMKQGPAGVPESAVPVLSLFCAVYAHLLMVLDDEEFYERQVPFTLEQQRVISAMLNTMVYNGFFSATKHRQSLLMDSAVRCLRSLYERDCRRSFCHQSLWLAPAAATHSATAAAARAHEVAVASGKMGEISQAPAMGAVLTTIPHVLPFDERVRIFREFVRSDKMLKRMGGEAVGPGPGTIEIAVRRNHIVDDGFAQLSPLGSKLKCCVNVSFVNEHGLSEAGLDYGGLFKEFLTDLAKAAFDPGYGLFMQTATDEGLLYPHPAAATLGHGLQMIEFLGRIVGKALYEGILLEYSFSPLFISKLLGRYSFLDELSSLDAELHRNLMYLKHYEGDARDLALDFTVTEELFGKRTIVELRPGGAEVAVTNENKLQYVHAVADYKLNRQMKPIINAFSRGLSDLIAPSWLGLFNAKEFNQLLSGGENDFDIGDLRANTRYSGGYKENSRTVQMFWEVVSELEPQERCSLLKFVTSCSRAPLLGFKHLQPQFTIHKVVCDTPIWALFGGQDVERLPSASTCYNTLKLPTYRRAGTLREKLRYAIRSNAGFELS